MPGLGCGAIIAPVLARLESVKGRGTVEVDRSGSYVRVRPAALLTEVLDVLTRSGAAANVLSAAETAEVMARPTRWYTRENVRELTREEFRVLVRRWSKEFEEMGAVTADEERRLVEGLDDAVDSAVETLPTNGVAPDRAAWRQAKADALERFLSSARQWLPEDRLERVRTFLNEQARR